MTGQTLRPSMLKLYRSHVTGLPKSAPYAIVPKAIRAVIMIIRIIFASSLKFHTYFLTVVADLLTRAVRQHDSELALHEHALILPLALADG